jgi:chloramphenicol-sensitive protein RarD
MKNKGILSGVIAYFIWGLFPIYWKLLDKVPALQLLGHRIIWSFILLALFLFLNRRWQELRSLAFRPKIFRLYFLAAILIGFNWFIYVWSVNSGYILDASLGYFINPLLSVFMGVVFLRERLRIWQWISVSLAGLGVIYLTAGYGRFPWIALTLAFTFGFYGFVKKLAPLSSIYGVALESGILFIPGLAFLSFQEAMGNGAFGHMGLSSDLLMAGAGVMTTIPLILFTSAAKEVPLVTLGLIQYITPTSQFLLGVFVYGEKFDMSRALGFIIVWIGLAIFCIEGLAYFRKAGAAKSRK